MPPAILRKNEVITTVLECSTQTLKDKKFWKVRYVPFRFKMACIIIFHALIVMSCTFSPHRLSGLELLLSLVGRVGNQKISRVESEKQLIMEAIREYEHCQCCRFHLSPIDISIFLLPLCFIVVQFHTRRRSLIWLGKAWRTMSRKLRQLRAK